MEIERSKRLATVRSAVLAVCLTAMVVALAMVIFYLSQQAHGAQASKQKYLYYVCWICAVLLGLVLVVLAWILLRLMVSLMPSRKRGQKTPYVNAWSLAGKRFKLSQRSNESGGSEADGDPEQDA